MGRSRGTGHDDDLPRGFRIGGIAGVLSMEVLAYIPELPCPALGTGPSGVHEAPCLTPAAATPSPPAERAVESVPAPAVSRSPAPWRGTARQSQTDRLFSPSIIVLMALATVVWAAAWRNDRLRWEAAQQRPERLAQEPAPTAGATRSITP